MILLVIKMMNIHVNGLIKINHSGPNIVKANTRMFLLIAKSLVAHVFQMHPLIVLIKSCSFELFITSNFNKINNKL